MTDWDEIRNACVENGESLKSLAERYGVSYGALRKRASREGWRKQKSRQERETAKREEIERAIAGAAEGYGVRRAKLEHDDVAAYARKADVPLREVAAE